MTPLTPALYNIIRYNIITIYLTITWHYNVITQNLGTAFLSPTPTKQDDYITRSSTYFQNSSTRFQEMMQWARSYSWVQSDCMCLKLKSPHFEHKCGGSKLAAPSCIQLPPPTWRGVCFPPYKCAENNKISPWSPFHYSQHDPHFRRTYLIISY